MTKSKKDKNKLVQKWWFWAIVVATLAVIVVVVIIIATPNNSAEDSKPKKLSRAQGMAIDEMEDAKYLSKINSSYCQEFQGIAKTFDSNARWFNDSFCKTAFYADFIESDSDYTVYLQDDNFCAEYTFVKNSEEKYDYSITDYKFSSGKCNSAYRITIRK